MKSKPRISILMGIYNCVNTLSEALDSLYAQTYNNFKLILCDDGSTDNTYQVAKAYAEKYDNIILLQNKENIKLAATLNRCLKHANTEYIARMDGDDISLPTRFEKEMKFLDKHPEYAVVSCAMIYFDENGDYMRSKPKLTPSIKDFIYGTPHSHAPCMVRKEAYDAVNGYTVDKRLSRGQDYNLWFKMYSKGFRGYNLSEPLYKMRNDKNAIARRTFKSRLNVSYNMSTGFKMLKLPFYYHIYALRPILVGLLPKNIYTYLHRRNKR